MTDVGPIDYVYYWTAEMDRAVAFYRDVIGLKLLRQDGSQWAEFATEPVRFALHGATEGHPVRSGGAAVMFRVDDLDGARRTLQEKGVEFDEHSGEVEGFVRFATFRDPDGNRVELIEHLGGGLRGGRSPASEGSSGRDSERTPRVERGDH